MSGLRWSPRVRRRTSDGVEIGQLKWLASLETWSKIISAIAIPVVLTIVGTSVQQTVATEGIKKDYVTMAIDILKDEKITDHELKSWALSIVRKNSPVPLSDQLQTKIVMGALSASNFAIWVPPPKSFMLPPDVVKLPSMDKYEAGELTQKDLAIGWLEAAKAAEVNAVKVKSLQTWARALEKGNAEFKQKQVERSGSRIIEEMNKMESK